MPPIIAARPSVHSASNREGAYVDALPDLVLRRSSEARNQAAVDRRRRLSSRDPLQHGASDAAHTWFLKLRLAILPPTHDLGKLGDEKARIRGDGISDGRSQGFEPKTELTLLNRYDVETR